jgi:hypothetical protein
MKQASDFWAYIPKGYYQNPKDLVDEINDLIKQFQFRNLPQLHFNDGTKKCSVSLGSPQRQGETVVMYPFLTDPIGAMLGFNTEEDTNFYEEKWLPTIQGLSAAAVTTPEAIKPVDVNSAVRLLLVCCNIVEHTVFGNDLKPLLRVVKIPFETKFGSQVNITFENHQYVDVRIKEFDMIEIYICNDRFEIVPFEFGRSVCVLQFRKKV